MNWTVGRKIGLGYALVVLVFAVVLLATYSNTLNFMQANRWVDETFSTIIGLEQVQSTMGDVEAGARGYIITGSRQLLAPYQAALRHIHQDLADLRPLVIDTPEQMPHLNKLQSLVGAELDYARSLIELRDRSGLEAARREILQGKIQKIMDGISQQVDLMQAFERHNLQHRQALDETSSRQTLHTILFGLLGGALLSWLIGWLLTRGLTSRLAAMTGAADRLAAGDLEVEFDTSGSDEVTALGRSFARMAERFRQTITRQFEQIALGNLNLDVAIHSERDQIGQALRRMVDGLQAKIRQFEEIAAGNLSGDVRVLSEQDQVGQAVQRMVEHLRRMAAVARQIALGNLNGSIQVSSDRDELGHTFQKMTADLRKLVSGIQEVTQRLGATSNEVLAASNEHEKIMQQQATAINETTSTITELVATQKQMAENARAIDALLQKTVGSVTQGNQEMDRAVRSLETIRHKSQTTSEGIAQLSERVRQIGKIVTTIREVTEQINLLALNAAIEAARAGEQGRGFAVVASEVRKLAERTDRSTADIAELVEDIQSSTNITVLSNEDNIKSVEVGVASISETSSVFGAMHDDVEALAQALEQMILSIRQQEAAFTQLGVAIKEINSGMNQSLQGTRQNVEAAGDLSRTAGTLKEHADQFKL